MHATCLTFYILFDSSSTNIAFLPHTKYKGVISLLANETLDFPKES
jgi:hypothetical protein